MGYSPGTKLGPYEIEASNGAGGMGEVYRAKDTRLGREVAIKVLPSSLTKDGDRYEMVSGQRVFRRDTAAETMTAILKEDPLEFDEMTNPVSRALERIVRRCLEKKPEQRFQSSSFMMESRSCRSSARARRR